MSVTAKCPKCKASSPVPDEAIGRKVRCKKCQTAFVVEASFEVSPAAEASPFAVDVPTPSATPRRPGSKASLSSSSGKSRPKSSAAVAESGSGVSKRPVKKSNATMWIIVGVVSVVVLVGGGIGAFMATQSEPPRPQAKAKSKLREEPIEKPASKTKDVTAKATTPAKESGGGAKTPGVNPKNAPPPVAEEKKVEPTAVAPLAASSPVELKEFSSIRAVFPLSQQPNKIGLHSVVGKDQFFEMYDLKKQERIAKVKLDERTKMIDVDPTGQTLATATDEKRFNIYALPDGALLEDEWAPYDNIRDEMRFLRGHSIAQIAMVDKNKFWVVTEPGHGDLWDLSSKKSDYVVLAPERTEFRKGDTVSANKDFVLSPGRGLFAYATDEGIGFHDSRTGKKNGSTPKLSKYGTKWEMVSMGFEPGEQTLAVYFTANKDGNRPSLHVRFSVPAGEELSVETLAANDEAANIVFVNGDYFIEFLEKNRKAELRDGKGKVVAECGFRGNFGMFAPSVVQSQVAFAFLNEKGVPSVGLAKVPVGGASAMPPPVVVVEEPVANGKEKEKGMEKGNEKGGGSLVDIFGAPSTPTPPPPPPAKEKGKGKGAEKQPPPKERQFETLEVWEFGNQGIIRKSIKTFAAQ